MTLHRPFRVAILLSGDDTPGMNPYLRHFVRLGLNCHGGIQVLGIKDGYSGLVNLARRVESGQSTVATCLKDIDTHKGLSGVDRDRSVPGPSGPSLGQRPSEPWGHHAGRIPLP